MEANENMENEFSSLQTAALLGLVLSFFITRLLIKAHLSDIPDQDRKIHKAVTATAGGIAIVAGFSASMLFMIENWIFIDKKLVFDFLKFALLGASVGLLDDIFSMGPKRRLAALISISALIVIEGFTINTLDFGFGFKLVMPEFIGAFFCIIWLLLIINIVNFMDGANGLSLGSLSLSFIFLAVLLYFQGEYTGTTIALCLTSAGFGFLVFNSTKGNIFAGDVGSYFYGISYGILGLWASKMGLSPFLIGLCTLPLLADGVLTVFHRIKHKEDILMPHRKHVYQLLIGNGKTHLVVSLFYWLATLVCGAVAILTFNTMHGYSALVFLIAVLISSLIIHTARKSINAVNHKIHQRY